MYTITVVSRLSGVPPETIRSWERRFGAVTPSRSSSGRRSYDDAQLRKIRLLGQLVRAGHAIGRIARLDEDTLTAFANEASRVPAEGEMAEMRAAILDGLEDYDAEICGRLASTALLKLTLRDAIDSVLAPLLVEVGRRWETGALSVAQEHMFSVTVRRALETVGAILADGETRPRFAFATLAGERHDLGALSASLLAASSGFSSLFLGADVPPADLADAARRLGVSAVGLSFVMQPATQAQFDDLNAFCDGIGPDVPVWLGGAAIASLDAERIPGQCRLFSSTDAYLHELSALRGRIGANRV